jgi:uncharacterized membrane protein HdeD (DUF308 family)
MTLEYFTRNWWVVVVRGAAAVLFGIFTLVLPPSTITTLAWLFGTYALVDGVVNMVAVSKGRQERQAWWMLMLEGLVGVVAGIITVLSPVALVYVIAAWALLTVMLEVLAAIRLQDIETEWLIGLTGALVILLAGLLAVAPGTGADALAQWIGAYAIAFGGLLVWLGINLGSVKQRRAPHTVADQRRAG